MGEELVLRSFETEENRSVGYEFSMIGDMVKALSRKHIYLDENTKSWQITQIVIDDKVRLALNKKTG